MRKVGTVLSLGLAFGVACSSTEESAPKHQNPELAGLARPDQPGEFGSADANSLRTANVPPPNAEAEDSIFELGTVLVSLQDDAQEDEGSERLLSDSAQRLTLAEQKKRFLVDQHIEVARSLFENNAFEQAATELSHALDLEPDNREAQRLKAEVDTLLGRPGAGRGTVPSDLAELYEVRVQQLQAEARESFDDAQLLLARGEYDQAIAELTIARNHIRWSPYGIDWNGLDQRVAELLERAGGERQEAVEAQERQAQERAYERLRAEERGQVERRRAQLDALTAEAIEAFEAGKYDEAQAIADRVLARDPRNPQARDISDTAFRAGRRQTREDYIATKRERYAQWYEDLSLSRIPFTDTVTLPDDEYWQRITELRRDRTSVDLSSVQSAEDLRIREQIRSMTIPGLTVDQEESIESVIAIIRTYTGLPLVVDLAAEYAAADEGVVFDYQLDNRLTVEQALNIITRDAGPEVTWTVRSEAIIVTTRQKARSKPTIKNHDVQDLVFGLTDFLGPRINRLRLLDDLEDDDGGGPFGGVGERLDLIEMSNLLTLVQENVAVGTWEDDGVSIDEGEGYLLVVHSPEVQKEVETFLNDLRRFTSSLVTIESKFLTIEDNFIQEIGIDWRGLDNPGTPFTDIDDITNGLEDMASQGLDNLGTGSEGAGASGAPSSGFFYDDGQDGDFKGRVENFFGNPLGDALSNVGGIAIQYTFLNDLELSAILTAVEKRSQIQLVNDQILSVHNSQRAYVSVVNQRAYIQDFDVEVAQFQSIADPVINVLTEGVVLDVRPTILHNRSYLRLEIQPTVATVRALRPFSTTLGGGTQPVEFQLPELEVQSVFTTAVIPDGGSILLGGLSNIRNIERRAEVPWIAKIPVVGFFFKQEGYSDENKSLMILIRAHITDVKEELAQLETAR